MIKNLQPPTWAPPKGYSNGLLCEGKLLFVAGQIGWDAQQQLVSRDFADQTAQALRNIVAILKEGGAQPQHIVRMTWYVTDKQAYLAAQTAIGVAYREIIGRHFPAMTLVQIVDLLETGALVEIEATAVIPFKSSA